MSLSLCCVRTKMAGEEEESSTPRDWLRWSETGKQFLGRVLSERPFVVPVPALRRVPLRLGNAVEISGPSGSAKSHVLLQAVVHFILPKEFEGIQFGGLERKVLFFDLDCKFDVLRLSQILSHRIDDFCGSIDKLAVEKLFRECMNRFLYIRCYSSSEFLKALKEIRYIFERRNEISSNNIRFLLIDSIGAFHWLDRGNQTIGDYKGKNISVQTSLEAIVHELKEILHIQPLLILATKSHLYSSETSNEYHRNYNSNGNAERNFSFREFMPSVWQSFVSHRIRLQVSEELFSSNSSNETVQKYTSEWVQPQLNMKEIFSIREDGIFLIP
ncbi:hypothetical protein LUZ60_001687 [Juncus effusus]|nr:hypothetical protein LUZ60_001687 [Juncus effusus]